MKFIAAILSLYLLVLLAIPCCGFDNCPDDKTEQTDHKQGDDDGCGNCSPFFSCTGCASVTVKAESIFFNNFLFGESRTYTSFIQPFFPQVDEDFWQPPRLA